MVSKIVVKNPFSTNTYHFMGVMKNACIESQFSGVYRFKG